MGGLATQEQSFPDGQVNVWGGALKPAERAFGRLGAAFLDAVSRLVEVRIVWLKHPERIGEIALHAGLEHAALRMGLRPRLTRYCIQRDYPIANTFWDECMRRMLPVQDWLWPIVQVTEQRIDEARRGRPRWLVRAHGVHQGLASRDLTGVLERAGAPPNIFRREEIEAGFDWLRSLGWRAGDKVVCLLVRDAEYLTTSGTGPGPGSGATRLERNSYRDSDIATYLPAAEWLADRGVWVLRMGKAMKARMGSQHPRVIDYAFRDDRSDFLDVWLFATCDLCISTGTGPDMISDVYRRPLLAVNYLPTLSLWSWSNAITAPKPIVWRGSGRRLSIEELVAAMFFYSDQYVQHGIEVRELDADLLRDIVEEAWLRREGNWLDQMDDVRRNVAAWEALEAHPEYEKYHGYHHPAARLSSVWLRRLEDSHVATAGEV